jgi:DNA-directed RNA polymerase subunit K/omega
MSLPVPVVTPSAAISNAHNALPLGPFHVASLAFQRAKQLKGGAPPRVESHYRSPTRLAQIEVLADTISWTVEPIADNVANKDRQ